MNIYREDVEDKENGVFSMTIRKNGSFSWEMIKVLFLPYKIVAPIVVLKTVQ